LKTAVDRTFNHGFIIDEQELRRIHSLALQQMKRVIGEDELAEKYEVKYKNDLVTETACFDEIFSENNGGKWEVQSLTIGLGTKISQSTLWLNRPQIRLSLKKGSRPITFSVEGENRDWVHLTGSQLEDRIAKVKRKNLWNGQLWGAISALAIVTFIFLVVVSFLRLSAAARTLSILLAILSGLIALSPFYIPYFFPAYNFMWGDYLDTFNKRQLHI
jgi:hypothetical protein